MNNSKGKSDFRNIDQVYPLILASASPRRRDLLQQVGLPFVILPADIDESGMHVDPAENAKLLAEKKACTVYSGTDNGWILGVDTTVVIEDTILGKPVDAADARFMLGLLSGKYHRVVSGFSILDPEGQPVCSDYVSTDVLVKRLAAEDISAYIATGEPFGKAGGYAIQGVGSFMIESINGSYSNVVGLPVCAVINAFLEVGALKRFPTPRSDTI